MQEKSKRLQMPKTWVQNFGSFMRPQGIQDKPFKSWICIKKRIIQSYKILVKITQHRSLGEQKAHLASWSDLLWCREAHWPELLRTSPTGGPQEKGLAGPAQLPQTVG